jgi:phosphoribosylamine---glycine ligase
MKKLKVLLLGSGGREHAIAWKLAQSEMLEKLYVAPGNAGTCLPGENVSLKLDDFTTIGKFVVDQGIGMVIVGPEDPLVNGISDFFHEHPQLSSVPIIGPGRKGAMLEGSKEFAKQFMQRKGIPTADFLSVTKDNLEEGITFLSAHRPPYVLKADGLAAGKGVLIPDQLSEAVSSLKEMLSGKFGTASKTVVIEEYLHGIELSVFVLTDGRSYVVLPEAKDYKRIGEGDTGPNTGGMGAVSPVPFADRLFMHKVEMEIIHPTILGLQKENIPYQGFIFIGLMNVKGNPFVIEYNCRLGDPETEVVLPRLNTDLLELFLLTSQTKLNEAKIEISNSAAATVMLVSSGYPGEYQKGFEIKNLDRNYDSQVFHAGTLLKDDKVLTNGGRVIAISSLGADIKEALNKSYHCAEEIEFAGKNYRRDIGFDLLNS